MGRPRREIYSGVVYEICMRTREGLPFTCTKYMKMLIESVMARVQRDEKVTLCHYLWMANHPHIIVVAKDKKACTEFYGEIQKQLTDAVKRLMGLKHLNLWKRNATSVIPYYDLETICYRIGYLYANPARAHLVDTIDEYPGVSSWEGFSYCKEESYSKECPWVRAPYIQKVSRKSISTQEDAKICNEWERRADKSHQLNITPDAWMDSFGIEDSGEIEELNQRILQFLSGLEQEAKDIRREKNRKPMGRVKLMRASVNLEYKSNKKSRRITVYSLDKKLRIYLIEKYQEFCSLCKECYEKWKCGDYSVAWPPGAFLPPKPHDANHFKPHISNTAAF